MLRIPIICLSAIVLVGLNRPLRAEDTSPATTATLEWQVAGLSMLNDLDLTGEQLKSLAAMADQTAIDPSAVPAYPNHPSPAYHAALLALRDALAAADEDKIGDAQDKVDDLREKLKVQPLPEFSPTDAARTKSRMALRLLSTGQIADYLAMHADEVPDASDTLDDALDECHDGSDADFDNLRDQAAAQVALLAAGMDDRATSAIAQRVTDLLDRARKMSPDQFDLRRAELDRSAKAITRSIDSFEALHRWMQHQVAMLLSNPQIGAILSMRETAQH